MAMLCFLGPRKIWCHVLGDSYKLKSFWQRSVGSCKIPLYHALIIYHASCVSPRCVYINASKWLNI